MKTRLLPAVLAGLFVYAAPAWADKDASMELTIEGTADRVCLMPAPKQTQAQNATFSQGQLIQINEMIDQGDATPNTASIRIEFPAVMCNYPAMVSVTSVKGGLILAGSDQAQAVSDSGALLDTVDYLLTTRWGSVELPELTTSGNPAGHTVTTEASGANVADLVIDIIISEQDTPVLAGQYTDDIEVTVGLPH